MACFDEALQLRQGAHHVRQAARELPARAEEARRHGHARSPRASCWPCALGRLKDEGKRRRTPRSAWPSATTCDMALEIAARLARDMLGANGITASTRPMRHMCNLESVNTYEGTHDIHTLILGHEITGIAAFA